MNTWRDYGAIVTRPAMDAAPDNPPDVELLTYAQLADRRGISRTSAERLARRRKWRRIPGNDGVTKVAVPQDWATLAPATPDDIRGRRVDPVPALRAAVDTLRDQLKREAERADKAERQVAELEAADRTRRAAGMLRRIRAAIRGD